MSFRFPTIAPEPAAPAATAYLVASGDLRESANRTCWPAQAEMEQALTKAFEAAGTTLRRAHEFDPERGHGMISSQAEGMRVFRNIPPTAPLVVAEAMWQYSHHVLAGLRSHQGPILTVANWSGQWPGLVGMLNLNGSLTKAGIEYSTLWSEEFTDDWFVTRLQEWITTGRVQHEIGPVRELTDTESQSEPARLGAAIAQQLQHEKAILGVFDEGCMGMYNAIIEDELLNAMGIYKERLSQSALVAEMAHVTAAEQRAVYDWLVDAGMTFVFGRDEATELTEEQVLSQCAMYIAALRIADDFSADIIGIQYQQGLKDCVPASDLAEGLLNDPNRPPVRSRDGRRELYQGKPLPHFNEVDEGAAVDALITNRIWTAMGLDPSTTLHDLRWGGEVDGQFVWLLEISGAVPASHFPNGYRDVVGMRQAPMYFPLGGSTLAGVSKPGAVVWSRLHLSAGQIIADLGVGHSIELPDEELTRRRESTNPEWPVMNLVIPGMTRDEFMARFKANHIQVAYAPDEASARAAMVAKAAALRELGVTVRVCD